MKRIKKEFVRSRFQHKQIRRVGNVAIFERWQVGSLDHHYEVVKISSHNGYKMGGAYIEPAETYPGASLWGLQGWTCNTIESAETKFMQMQKRFNKKKRELQYV